MEQIGRIREILIILLGVSCVTNILLVSRLHEIEPDHETPFETIHVSNVPANQPPNGGSLRCEAYGGPSDLNAVADLEYWRDDIPIAEQFRSVYEAKANNSYFVFEPDEAGFSNVRLSFETVVAFSLAMGRILVLPPKKPMTQLSFQHPEGVRSYSYSDFFNLRNVPMISMEEYLERVAMNGQLRDETGAVTYPLFHKTKWDYEPGEIGLGELSFFYSWLSKSMHALNWNRDTCVIVFPSAIQKDIANVRSISDLVIKKDKGDAQSRTKSFIGRPNAVNASAFERFREVIGERTALCEYDDFWQQSESIFIAGHEVSGSRPLIQFYSFLFFEDWRQDLQMKRFMRDNVRFADVIQCAAARIVQAIRHIATKASKNGTNVKGSFDTMHIRRSDFKTLPTFNQRKDGAEQIVTDKFFEDHRTVYIATDEQDKSFFDPIRTRYTILFMEDFNHLLRGIDPNYFGMIEQLVCAKGDKFVGTYYSTFSAYVNRVRGYHAQKEHSQEAMKGILNSEYAGQNGRFRDAHKQYVSANKDFWHREWPIAWRDIDFGT